MADYDTSGAVSVGQLETAITKAKGLADNSVNQIFYSAGGWLTYKTNGGSTNAVTLPETQYSKTTAIVGTWVDNSDICRIAFSRALSSAETSAGYVAAKALIEGLTTTATSTARYFIINDHVMFLQSTDGEAIPELIDDRRVQLSNGTYPTPSSAYDWVYGYIDYVAY